LTKDKPSYNFLDKTNPIFNERLISLAAELKEISFLPPAVHSRGGHMYIWFYGFSEEPFSTRPDPKFLLLTETHQQALDCMIQGIQERQEFTLLLGEGGSGKTTLIHHLLDTVGKEVKAVAIFKPRNSLEEFLEGTLYQLGIDSGQSDRGSMIRQLGDYLNTLDPDGTLVVIIDEAHDLSPRIINEIRLLFTPGISQSRKLQMIFAGRPELKDKFELEKPKEVEEKANIGWIEPLNEEECQRYISHRLNRVGGDMEKIFAPEAISEICRNARGNPRTINVLCDNSLMIGYGLSKKKVDSEIVAQVLEEQDYVEREDPRQWKREEGRRRRNPRIRRATSPLLRKLGYSLLALVGVGGIILLGKAYLKGPGEPPSARFPIQPPKAEQKSALAPSEDTARLTAKAEEDLKPGGPARTPEPKLSGPESPPPSGETRPPVSGSVVTPTSPASTPAGKAPSASPAERKSSAPSSEPERKVVTKKPLPPSPGVKISGSKIKPDARIRRTVVVGPKDSLYTIAARTYRIANTSVADYILESNPGITNPNRLLTNQKIRLPEITEESLIIGASDRTCRIWLGTFLKPEYSTFLREYPPLKEKTIEIVPRKFSSGETWYRAVAGKFSTREESLRLIHAMREKGLCPFFAGFRKSQ
jgi:general secretion pathway protein A